MTDKDLLLFTTSFPYGTITEASFVMAELPYLCQRFRRVIIIPEIYKGDPIDISNYPNVTVDNSRVKSIDHRHPLIKLSFALHPSVVKQELKSILHTPLSKWPTAWSMAINRYRISNNLKDIIRRLDIDCSHTVFYTFWFDHVTEAIAMALPPEKGALVSGAHGHDIYPYPDTFKSHTFRLIALSRMTRLYAASHEGAGYLKQAYPSLSAKIDTRTLGSPKITHDFTTIPHQKGEPITFFSCSRVDANKRVTLNYKLIRALALCFPTTQFRWIHVGDGDQMQSLRHITQTTQPSNLSIELTGAVNNTKVHHIYQSVNIDWAMLLSTMEGGNPITLSEALSYGVPVITCDVPGCREIANDSVGLLLSSDPTVKEFIARISPYICGEKSQSTLRKAAFRHWSEHFDASKLRAKFASELSSLPTQALITR